MKIADFKLLFSQIQVLKTVVFTKFRYPLNFEFLSLQHDKRKDTKFQGVLPLLFEGTSECHLQVIAFYWHYFVFCLFDGRILVPSNLVPGIRTSLWLWFCLGWTFLF
jgi:hypothetical protein